MTKQVHLAAQYLATANINFLDKKEDDSHTNLGFNTKKGLLETWPLTDEGSKIVFDYNGFSLHWVTQETIRRTIFMDGKTHQEVVQWMSNVTRSLGLNTPYTYQLHYDLPYEKITADFTFQKPQEQELKTLLRGREIVQNALETTRKNLNLNTDIRIWPHHFDTGGFIVLDAVNMISLGFGMAIPDTVVDDFYLYVSGYKGHDGMDTTSFKKLSVGSWRNEGFKGATLPMQNIDDTKAIAFFKEAITMYKLL